MAMPGLRAAEKNDVSARMMEIIRQSWNDPDFNMDVIAAKLNMNANYLRQVFKAGHGMSFVKFIRETRLQSAAKLLISTDMQINQISEKVGYIDSAYFSLCFRDAFAASPSEYRNLHRADEKND